MNAEIDIACDVQIDIVIRVIPVLD
jgi:hypothetical protein